jgi:hypothetical protein
MRCSGGKSPASLNIISALPDGVVLIQRRVSQSARVISDKTFIMIRLSTRALEADIGPSSNTSAPMWTLVQ